MFFPRFRPLAAPGSLLVCRPDRVGDVIIATSCLEPVHRHWPGVRVTFVARERMRSLLEGHPLIESFIALPEDRAGAAVAELARQYRAADADALVQLHPDLVSQTAARRAGVPRRAGFRSGWWADGTLTDPVADRRRAGRQHEAEHNFHVLKPLGLPAPTISELHPSVHLAVSWQRSLRLRLTAIGCEKFDEADSNYAVLNPTAFSIDHRWPPEHWVWLARELRKHGFERVFLVAESAEDPSMRAIRHLLGAGVPGVVDLSSQTNLAELGWLLRSARVFVSRNTGSTHLAGAVDCPTVELFGRLEPTYGPARWRSLGARAVTVLTEIGRARWLETRRAFWRRGHLAISRDAVLAAALRVARTQPGEAPGAL